MDDVILDCMHDLSMVCRDRLAVGMSLTLFLLPFLPASGIIFKVGFVIAER